MRSRFLHLVAPLAALALAACGTASPSQNPSSSGGSLVKSNKPRLSAANVPAADIAQQSQDNEGFAFDLYTQLSKQPGNLFYSPYSISSALAMLWAGAANQTASDMAGALHFSMPANRVNGAFNALDAALQSRSQEGTAEDGTPFKLNIANAIWAQQDMDFLPSFLDTLAQNYGAGVRTEPFASDPSAALSDINNWVSDETAGLIPQLLQQSDILPSTRLVLTNAIYFNGSWKYPFDSTQTQTDTFHNADGSTAQVPFMHQSLMTGYAKGQGWQLVEIPYSNDKLTLTVLVPDQGQLASIESQLSQSFFDGAVASESEADVVLGLPKFKTTTHVSLKNALTALGMGAAFDPSTADFSGIDGQRDLHVSDVIHQATVSIDEAGTQAAASTAVIAVGGAISQPIELTIDRPFLIVLRDQPTGAVLFVGRISKP